MSITDEAEYGQKQINTLELIWGEGFLSPGGIQEIDYVLNNSQDHCHYHLFFDCKYPIFEEIYILQIHNLLLYTSLKS